MKQQLIFEAGYQAGGRDLNMYGKPMCTNYSPWDENGSFEQGYNQAIYEWRKEKINEQI